MSIKNLLESIKKSPSSIDFSDVISTIDGHYEYNPVNFINGEVENQAGTNEGSCKIFAFAQINGLSQEETLSCFGDYYRKDVLENPDGEDHANIRHFMITGWDGIHFDDPALQEK